MENIRGIECSLFCGEIREFLFFMADMPFNFYVQRCMKIGSDHSLLPKSFKPQWVSPNKLKELAKDSIWELVLHAYPPGVSQQTIDTYDDFINSQCICCLIFYDCCLLDLYVKNSSFRKQLEDMLQSLQAENIALITDESDGRTSLNV